MKQRINPEHRSNLQILAQQFQSAPGFPHIGISNFVDPDFLREAAAIFPEPDEMMYHYDSIFEKGKHSSDLSNPDRRHEFPEDILPYISYFNSPYVINFLEELSGISGLIPDPYFHGGGLHQTTPGGFLDLHLDFNRQTWTRLHRRLNLIVWLNKDWEDEWEGHLELWSGIEIAVDEHEVSERLASIKPDFNTIGVFATSERSYHGHPWPLACPDGKSRKSFALYYYTADRDDEFRDTPYHNTMFVKHPDKAEPDGLGELRKMRNHMMYRDFVKEAEKLGVNL